MDYQSKIDKVKVVFFSGTGGTKRIAEGFERELNKRGRTVETLNLGARDKSADDDGDKKFEREADLYILLFPVYAFDAPKPVYRWIEAFEKQTEGKQIAVISVSGGGEMWPNTGCRNNCCKKLEQKGFHVVYDNMMCMPANLMAEVSDHLAMRLINIIPEKVSKALDIILSGQIQRTHFHKSALRNFISNQENKNASKYAKTLIISDDCKGCGWCAKNCPTGNIEIDEQSKKPKFLDQCTVCMRCTYGCPIHAISSKSSMVFKKGFDLDAIERRMEGVELEPIEKCCRGIAWIGVRDYLLNKY